MLSLFSYPTFISSSFVIVQDITGYFPFSSFTDRVSIPFKSYPIACGLLKKFNNRFLSKNFSYPFNPLPDSPLKSEDNWHLITSFAFSLNH